MSCGSCGSNSKSGTPSGCKSHGSCASGACNRLNVHDWLSLVPVADFNKPYPIVEVSFRHGARKDFYKTPSSHLYEKGDIVTLEGSNGGYDVGVVSITGELVKLQMKKRGVKESSEEIKKLLRKSTEQEIQKSTESIASEKELLINARVIIRELNINMKLADVEIQADGKKATFFYTADDRVDFRELIKRYAAEFKVRVEMKQIGARQEAAKVGGIGSCGRELCCSTWLNDFKSVNTSAARYQNLSINQTKLSGQCGRLKCCLNYELDTYMDALQVFPDNADKIETAQGTAYLNKRDIFKNLMWYNFSGSNKLYPLTIARVKEIQEENKKGIKPTELQAVEVTKKDLNTIRTEYVDVVGQTSLKSLERLDKKRRDKQKQEGKAPQPKKAQKGNNTAKDVSKPKDTLNNLLSPNTPKPKPKTDAPINTDKAPNKPNNTPRNNKKK